MSIPEGPAPLPAEQPARSGAVRPAEGEAPAALPEDFVETLYLALNPDVADAKVRGIIPSGGAHWLTNGWREERDGQRPSLLHEVLLRGTPDDAHRALLEESIEVEGYLHLYPDVAAAFDGRPAATRRHFLDYGLGEGRLGPGLASGGGRRPDLASLMALPFGIDVYGAFGDRGGRGAQGRALLRRLQAAGVPHSAFAFDLATGRPRVPTLMRTQGPTYRVSLLLAEPTELVVLAALYPPGHFDATYVIAACEGPPDRCNPAFVPPYGVVDEFWVTDEPAREAYAAALPVPAEIVPMPLPERGAEPVAESTADGATAAVEARAGDALVVLFSETGEATARLAAETIGALRDGLASAGLGLPVIVAVTAARPGPDVLTAIQNAIQQPGRAAMENASVLVEPMTELVADFLLQRGRALLVPQDGADGLFLGQLFASARKPILAARDMSLVRRLAPAVRPVASRPVDFEPANNVPRQQHRLGQLDTAALLEALSDTVAGGARQPPLPAEQADVAASVVGRLSALGLDVPPPPFMHRIGATTRQRAPRILTSPDDAALGASERDTLVQIGRRAPMIGMLLPIGDAADDSARADAERTLSALRTQAYPFWTLILLLPDGAEPPWLATLRQAEPRVLSGDRAAVGEAVGASRAVFLTLLRLGEVLARRALLDAADALASGAAAVALAGEGPVILAREHWQRLDAVVQAGGDGRSELLQHLEQAGVAPLHVSPRAPDPEPAPADAAVAAPASPEPSPAAVPILPPSVQAGPPPRPPEPPGAPSPNRRVGSTWRRTR